MSSSYIHKYIRAYTHTYIHKHIHKYKHNTYIDGITPLDIESWHESQFCPLNHAKLQTEIILSLHSITVDSILPVNSRV
jgi:hypothetical protein